MLLILFLLVSQNFMVTPIGCCHSDRNKDHLSRVSCVSQGLTAVSDGIDPGTEVLVLSQNMFVSLSWAAYTTFTRLHELDLSQNLISNIIQSGPVLENLRVLRLSNNKLTGLGGATFKPAPSLMEIYLDGNTISSLDDGTFSDLPLLELINLSHNKLHILPPHLLKHISSSNLKNFDLEGNFVQLLPDDFFASKSDLPYVFLSNNLWVCTCQVSYLQHYLDDQSHNVYIHTGPLSIENDPGSVVCSAPPTLKGRAIMDLEEEEYCSSVRDPQQYFSSHMTLSAATTSLTRTIVQPRSMTTVPTIAPSTVKPKSMTTVLRTTASTTIQPKSMTTVLRTTAPTTIQPKSMTTVLRTTAPTTIQPKSMTTVVPTTAPTTVQPMMPKDAKSITTNVPALKAKNPTTITPRTTETTSLISIIATNTTLTTTQPAATRTTDLTIPATSTPMTTEKTTSTTTVTAEFSSPLTPTTQTTNNTTAIRSVATVTGPVGGILSAQSGGRSSVSWCWWLFSTVLLLCVFSAIFSCVLFFWLIITYVTLHQPIKRRVCSSQGVTLRAYRVTAGRSVTLNRTEEEKVKVLFLPPEIIRETQPVFRSVLFISKGNEEGEADEWKKGRRNEEKKKETDTQTKIDLLPTVTQHREQETETKESQEVFRKTLYRVISREEEIEGWKELEENRWGMTEKDKGRREERMVKRKTRYSLILREERGSVMEGREGETEWLVGEWEIRGGAQESCRSLIMMKEACGLSDSAHVDTPEPGAETSA